MSKIVRRLHIERCQSPGAYQSALLSSSRCTTACDRVSAKSVESVDNDASTQNNRLLVHDEGTAMARFDGALHHWHTHDQLPLSEARGNPILAANGTAGETIVPGNGRRDQMRLL